MAMKFFPFNVISLTAPDTLRYLYLLNHNLPYVKKYFIQARDFGFKENFTWANIKYSTYSEFNDLIISFQKETANNIDNDRLKYIHLKTQVIKCKTLTLECIEIIDNDKDSFFNLEMFDADDYLCVNRKNWYELMYNTLENILISLEYYNNVIEIPKIPNLNIDILEIGNKTACDYYERNFCFNYTCGEEGYYKNVPFTNDAHVYIAKAQQNSIEYPYFNYAKGFISQYKEGIPEAIIKTNETLKHQILSYIQPIEDTIHLSIKYIKGVKTEYFDEQKAYEYGRKIALSFLAWEEIIISLPAFDDIFKIETKEKLQVNKENIILKFEDLFFNPNDAEPCLRILKEIQPMYVDEANNYIGKNKGIFPLWIKVLKSTIPSPLIKHLKDIEYKDILNSKIKGLNLTRDASEFRKSYSRIENSNVQIDIKQILSQYSQNGKLGK